MNRTFRTALIAASLFVAGTAYAFNFETIAGQNFSQSYSFTPALTDRSALRVFGFSMDISAISFEILGSSTPLQSSSVAAPGYVIAAFNDATNSDVQLSAGTKYTLIITGHTLPGRGGLVAVNPTNATISTSPVPEPGIYSMLLSGLACVGLIARRRRKS